MVLPLTYSTCEYPSDCKPAKRASLYASVGFLFRLPLSSSPLPSPHQSISVVP